MTKTSNSEVLDLDVLGEFIKGELDKLEMMKNDGGGNDLLPQVQDLLESILFGQGSGFQCRVCSESVLGEEILLCYCPFGRHVTHCRNKVLF